MMAAETRSGKCTVLASPFLLPSVSELSARLHQDHVGAEHPEARDFCVHRSHREEGPGKNLPFSVENKWRLLVMMTWYFGSGFAEPFFIVRSQLLKK